jgi:hypothetical protein
MQMSNRKNIDQQIESTQEKIKQEQNRLKELYQKQKEQERKERTKRLCKRAGLLESLLVDTIALTDEQFYAFLEKTVANDYGRRILANIATQDAKDNPSIPPEEGNKTPKAS